MALVPAALLQLPSGCHLLPHCKAASTTDLSLFQADSCITPCSRHADERYTQMTGEELAPAQSKTTYSQNGVSAAFGRGLRDNWCVPGAELNIWRWVLHEIKSNECVRMLRFLSAPPPPPPSSSIHLSAHLEMCLGSACPWGQKNPLLWL